MRREYRHLADVLIARHVTESDTAIETADEADAPQRMAAGRIVDLHADPVHDTRAGRRRDHRLDARGSSIHVDDDHDVGARRGAAAFE